MDPEERAAKLAEAQRHLVTAIRLVREAYPDTANPIIAKVLEQNPSLSKFLTLNPRGDSEPDVV